MSEELAAIKLIHQQLMQYEKYVNSTSSPITMSATLPTYSTAVSFRNYNSDD